MRIKSVTNKAIIFDNGNKITFRYCQKDNGRSWADFTAISEWGRNRNFSENLWFKEVEGLGFYFGSNRNQSNAVFIPCYSNQTEWRGFGDVSIYYNRKHVLMVDCAMYDEASDKVALCKLLAKARDLKANAETD